MACGALCQYSFFTAHRDSSDFIMRWLHLEGADRLNILRHDNTTLPTADLPAAPNKQTSLWVWVVVLPCPIHQSGWA